MTFDATSTLHDFFNGTGRFQADSVYGGMAASEFPSSFLEYFKGLSQREKQDIVLTLVAAAFGKSAPLLAFSRDSIRLMCEMCIEGYSAYFDPVKETLERELTNEANVRRWAEAGDENALNDAVTGGWRYGLMLWGVLYMLRSDKAVKVYQDLVHSAESKQFREALSRARDIYDRVMSRWP